MAGSRVSIERTLREASGHARDGLAWPEFGAAMLDVLRRAVPHDGAVVATVDPASGLLTSIVSSGVDESMDELFMHIELTHPDPITLTTLAKQKVGVGILADHVNGDPRSNPRVRELLSPHFDLEHELRGVARIGGRMWAACGLYRARQRPGFDAEEATLLSALEGVFAQGVRGSQVAQRRAARAGLGPAVVILDADGRVCEVTAEAVARLEAIGHKPGSRLPAAVRMAATAVRVQAHGQVAAPVARLRGRDGQWLVIQAAALGNGSRPGRIAVTIELADTSGTLELDLDVYGLTDRERGVVRAVVAGASTTRIAVKLGISPHTVQDHLKAVFRKTETSSRRELVAKLAGR